MPFWPSVLLACFTGAGSLQTGLQYSSGPFPPWWLQLGSANGGHWRRLEGGKKGEGIFFGFLLLVSVSEVKVAGRVTPGFLGSSGSPANAQHPQIEPVATLSGWTYSGSQALAVVSMRAELLMS